MVGYSGALVDSGANGGLAGSDTHILSTFPHAHVDITGVGGGGGGMLWNGFHLCNVPLL